MSHKKACDHKGQSGSRECEGTRRALAGDAKHGRGGIASQFFVRLRLGGYPGIAKAGKASPTFLPGFVTGRLAVAMRFISFAQMARKPLNTKNIGTIRIFFRHWFDAFVQRPVPASPAMDPLTATHGGVLSKRLIITHVIDTKASMTSTLAGKCKMAAAMIAAKGRIYSATWISRICVQGSLRDGVARGILATGVDRDVQPTATMARQTGQEQ